MVCANDEGLTCFAQAGFVVHDFGELIYRDLIGQYANSFALIKHGRGDETCWRIVGWRIGEDVQEFEFARLHKRSGLKGFAQIAGCPTSTIGRKVSGKIVLFGNRI